MGRLFWPAVLLLVVLAAWLQARIDAVPTGGAVPAGRHGVRYVIDGDTLVLASGVRVRLQGIDTPEVARGRAPGEPWSQQAKAFTQRFVATAGGHVRLSFGDERQDRYGRCLAFVWRGDTMLNEELVRAGLATARPDFRFSGRMKRRLLRAQDEAKAAGRALWSGALPGGERKSR